MYDYGKLVYLDLQKTGSRFVVDFLETTCKLNLRYGIEHTFVREEYDPSDFYFITIRHPVKQYSYLFGLDNINLEFTDGAIKAIASKAQELKTGARGLKKIIEEALLKYQYDAEDLAAEGLETITIQEETITNSDTPLLVYRNKRTNGKKH